ncbi:hypothetical protein LTR16_003832 [Cryomyces antarcticus]|uniref:RNA helicase n=1 Tax=Cryomyces antarcticus TaxID=329879 RepID=A0ABR0KS76_9PEZI|nr:hypothetical protein LTR60_002668 [Cryomyces antarcticus]KAK5018674.1 hypothetical protein LTR39_000845 [Cryomyces antarcticus]KAK5123254.1 hypothetical protein LTR16_003832 [Cryomyces antarcticus]
MDSPTGVNANVSTLMHSGDEDMSFTPLLDLESSNAYATSDLHDALEDATGPAIMIDKAAATTKAREAGWAPTSAYDYDTYNASTKGDKDGLGEVGPAWASTAAKYEWKEEYGDVGPAVPALEAQLFNHEFVMRAGSAIKALEFTVTVESPNAICPVREFDDAALHPIMRENIRLCGYEHPTAIQAYCLPAILQGVDVIACAQTGSGKTAAYLIPVISKLLGKVKKLAAWRPNAATFNPDDPNQQRARGEPLVLVVCPSRELAMQIFDEARRLCYRSMLRPCVAYGGAPSKQQRLELQTGCDVLIATPGRLCDFMDQPGILSLKRVKYTVIDEADEMLQDDWDEGLKKIMAGGDANEDADHVLMMFSATFPKEARELARQYMSNEHIRIRVGRAGSAHENVTQKVIFVKPEMKRKCLYDLLFSMPPARTIIFVNNKKTADEVDDHLFNLGLPSTSIHADRTQAEREDAIRAFRTGAAPILVATGVSARGLDVKNVMHVINYDLPSSVHGGIEEYVHRIGRTARIGNAGLATSFYTERNEDIANNLVKLLMETGQEIPDFLQDRVPEDGKAIFDDDTDSEEEGKADSKESVAGDDEKAAGTDTPTTGGVDLWGAPAAAVGLKYDKTW